MAGKTQPVKDLVSEVLSSIAKPYSADITEEVCRAIERNPKWRGRYDVLAADLRSWVVNNWIGVYTCQLTGRRRGAQRPSAGSLIKSYSRLVT